MLYSINEFLQLLKEDLELTDLPLPVDDEELIKRIQNHALKDFSVLYPRIEEVVLTSNNCVSRANMTVNGSATYEIPREYYEGAEVLAVLSINQSPRNGQGAGIYYPSFVFGSADSMIGAIADIKLAAAMGSQFAHSPTFRFFKGDPPKLILYNAWYGGNYNVELALSHNINLTTIPDTALIDFKELCQYDLESFLYSKLKRKDRLDLGIGNIEMKIDDWADSKNKYRELIKEWRDNGAEFDSSTIVYYN